MTDAPFEIRSSRVGDAVIVEVLGEIDMSTAPELTTAIDSLKGGALRVVVDLSAVGFLDSSALNALVHGQRDLAQGRVVFRVVSPADSVVRRVFDITNLTEQLGVVESLAEALS